MDRVAFDDFVARAHMQVRADELAAATVVALDAFESAGVGALLMKGPVLAERLYAPDESRDYHDVDLLVPPRALASARVALKNLGYTTDEVSIDDIGGFQHGEVWARHTKNLRGVWIDLHWRL